MEYQSESVAVDEAGRQRTNRRSGTRAALRNVTNTANSVANSAANTNAPTIVRSSNGAAAATSGIEKPVKRTRSNTNRAAHDADVLVSASSSNAQEQSENIAPSTSYHNNAPSSSSSSSSSAVTASGSKVNTAGPRKRSASMAITEHNNTHDVASASSSSSSASSSSSSSFASAGALRTVAPGFYPSRAVETSDKWALSSANALSASLSNLVETVQNTENIPSADVAAFDTYIDAAVKLQEAVQFFYRSRDMFLNGLGKRVPRTRSSTATSAPVLTSTSASSSSAPTNGAVNDGATKVEESKRQLAAAPSFIAASDACALNNAAAATTTSSTTITVVVPSNSFCVPTCTVLSSTALVPVSSASDAGAAGANPSSTTVPPPFPSAVQLAMASNYPPLLPVFSMLQHREGDHAIVSYLAHQPQITPHMRSVLVDWMREVSAEHRLHDETYFLAVRLVDRLLSAVPVPRKELQLVGAACVLLSAKLEEIHALPIQNFEFLCDKLYTRQQFVTMETVILRKLNYQLHSPHVFTMMNEVLQIVDASNRVRFICQYVAYLMIVDYNLALPPPSVVAVAIVALVLKSENMSPLPALRSIEGTYTVTTRDAIKLPLCVCVCFICSSLHCTALYSHRLTFSYPVPSLPLPSPSAESRWDAVASAAANVVTIWSRIHSRWHNVFVNGSDATTSSSAPNDLPLCKSAFDRFNAAEKLQASSTMNELVHTTLFEGVVRSDKPAE